ncbi:MAG: T9SS type A sorting domain-containing protein [Flavobacteriales bacterium]|nr:T9SS type A sorting domain-containing protein [Flavobacteriales bacterium]MBP9080831.1 T9SS type A sorting domain-containing protein [Flavobacteriales bacterium]
MNKLDASRKIGINDKLAYPGMALAFLAAAAEAEGQIVYTDLDPDVVISFSSYDVDLDNDGTGELEITRTEFGSMHYVGITDLAPGASILGVYYYNDMFPNVLAPGDPIAANNPQWEAGPQGWLFSFYSYGQWNNQSGFLGVRFQSGADTLYAWVELEMTYNTAIVKGYAYESQPGTAINAGDTGLLTALPAGHKAANGLSLFPNPAVDRIHVAGLTGTVDLRVLALDGRVVHAQQATLADTQEQALLEVGAWPAGTYVVEARSGGRIQRSTFVKH